MHELLGIDPLVSRYSADQRSNSASVNLTVELTSTDSFY